MESGAGSFSPKGAERGDVANRSFSIIYFKQGHVAALDCVNAVKDYMQGKAFVVDQLKVDPAELADTMMPLKALAAHHLLVRNRMTGNLR